MPAGHGARLWRGRVPSGATHPPTPCHLLACLQGWKAPRGGRGDAASTNLPSSQNAGRMRIGPYSSEVARARRRLGRDRGYANRSSAKTHPIRPTASKGCSPNSSATRAAHPRGPCRSRVAATAARTWVGVGSSERCSIEANNASARTDETSEGVMRESPILRTTCTLVNTACPVIEFTLRRGWSGVACRRGTTSAGRRVGPMRKRVRWWDERGACTVLGVLTTGRERTGLGPEFRGTGHPPALLIPGHHRLGDQR